MTRHTDWLVAACLAVAAPLAAAGPLLTGVVEDVDAQTIEMPALPGAWQRRIEWMAKEGTRVATGDVVVRLDPGDLISQEEQTRTDLEKTRLAAVRRENELRLEVLDAEKALAQARSRVRVAELDAALPASTIPRLDYERYQLELETSRQALVRAQAEVLTKERELEDVIAENALEVAKAASTYERIKAALDATEIRAEKAGFIIYSQNRFTGRKVFPGETLFTGFEIASIASREDLQLRFWVHEADLLAVTPGQLMEITPDAVGAEPFEARVARTSSQAIRREDWGDGGYFEIVAEPLAAVPSAIMPGMSVMGRVADDRPGGAS